MVHTPEHTPLAHVWFVHEAGGPQLPMASHCSAEFPTHWCWYGVHCTQAPRRHCGVVPAHVVWLCQLPIASHDWTVAPAHCVSP
jgi:hypothetical protein